MKFVHRHHDTHTILIILLLGFIFTFHVTLPVYIGSTFLSTLISNETIGLVYSIASALSVMGLLLFPRILRAIGNYETFLVLIGLDALALTGLIFFNNVLLILLVFILNAVAVTLAVLNIDIFLEHSSDNKHTGGIRGLFLTIVNIAWISSPFLTGTIVTQNNYRMVYIASLLLLIPLILLLNYNFRNFKDPRYKRLGLIQSFATVRKDKRFRNIFCSNIFLNLFYGWMIIYTPLYLNKYIGFNWETIGIIFTIMLLPFIIFELPLGRLADSHFGEKEMLSAGFVIMGTFTALIAVIQTPSIFLWALTLFMTRVGAAITEVMVETYFFKQIHERDSSILGLFRTTRPLGYLIAPVLATVTLTLTDFRHSFIVLGVLMFFGLYYSLTLKDTR